MAAIPRSEREALSVEHLTGEMTCVLEIGKDGEVEIAALLRTARKLMNSEVFAELR